MWTPVAKPTGTPWTSVNFSGKETYDESTILYDDPNVFWDGTPMGVWTNVAKPVSSTWTMVSKPT